MRLLLHACCGPCSLPSTRVLAEEGIDYSIFYSNSNIYPPEEYHRRLDTLVEHVAKPQSIEVIEDDYDPQLWEERVGVFGTDRESRCRACYRLRFEKTAKAARELGYDAICTTLSISPYQFTDAILEELGRAADQHGLHAEKRDFREFYPESVQRSRELEMYRQNYCGCRFSIAEAKEQREQHKREQARASKIKHRAIIAAAAEGSFNQANQV